MVLLMGTFFPDTFLRGTFFRHFPTFGTPTPPANFPTKPLLNINIYTFQVNFIFDYIYCLI